MKPILSFWYREMLRNCETACAHFLAHYAVMWLVLFGSGIPGSLNFRLSFFPVLTMYVPFSRCVGYQILFTSMFSALSLVRDRESLFERKFSCLLSALGNCARQNFGGATVASISGHTHDCIVAVVDWRCRGN